MFSMPGIVLVDNDENELAQLTEAFRLTGLPCLPIHYLNDSSNRTGLDHVNIPENLKTRILITDLNLREGQKLDAVNLVSPIATVIETIINSGPYILVIWSKHTEEPEQVVKLLEERFKDKIELPIEWVAIDKNNFIPTDADDINIKNDELKERIKSIVEDSPLFNALIDWESRVSEAARETTGSLYNLTKPVDYKGDNYMQKHQENIQQVLTAIANETVGIKNAAYCASSAIDSGLMPVVSDQLSSITENDESDKIWKNALPSLGTPIELSNEVKAELNSFNHIENIEDNHPKNYRGVFVGVNPDYLTEQDKKEKLEKHIGRAVNDVLGQEFLFPGGHPKDQRQPAKESVKLGFLELSAACDHAQNKIRMNRYILGIMVPLEFKSQTIFKDGNGNELPNAHNGIYRMPLVNIDNKKYVVLFSFKYQLGSHENNQWFGAPLFRIREQTLSEVSFLCSQYSSRPGITSFY